MGKNRRARDVVLEPVFYFVPCLGGAAMQRAGEDGSEEGLSGADGIERDGDGD